MQQRVRHSKNRVKCAAQDRMLEDMKESRRPRAGSVFQEYSRSSACSHSTGRLQNMRGRPQREWKVKLEYTVIYSHFYTAIEIRLQISFANVTIIFFSILNTPIKHSVRVKSVYWLLIIIKIQRLESISYFI